MAGSMQKLGNNRYKFTVSAGFGAGHKRNRYYRTVTAKNDKEAEKLLAKFVVEVESGIVSEPSSLTLEGYLKKWLEHIKTMRKPPTVEGYRWLTKKTIESLGHIRIQKLKPTHLNEFYALLSNDGLSGESVRHYHRMLSSALQTAVKWGIVMENPARKADPPKSDTQEMKSYNAEEIALVIKALDNEFIHWRILCLIAIALGLRRGELCGLKWTDIDFNNKTLTVNRTAVYISKQGVLLLSPKSYAGKRTISIPIDLLNELVSYKEYQEKANLSQGKPLRYLFTQTNGNPICPDSVSKWWLKFRKKNNFPKLTFHGLRHTSATLLISAGVDINTLRKRLGHSDPSITFRYLHQMQEADQIASQKINDIMAITKKL